MRSREDDCSKNNFRTNIFYNNLENYKRYGWTDVLPDNSQISQICQSDERTDKFINLEGQDEKFLYIVQCTSPMIKNKTSQSVDKIAVWKV